MISLSSSSLRLVTAQNVRSPSPPASPSQSRQVSPRGRWHHGRGGGQTPAGSARPACAAQEPPLGLGCGAERAGVNGVPLGELGEH